jgi:hypothetical protein
MNWMILLEGEVSEGPRLLASLWMILSCCLDPFIHLFTGPVDSSVWDIEYKVTISQRVEMEIQTHDGKMPKENVSVPFF